MNPLQNPTCKYCFNEAEWLEELCQEHWEAVSSISWWVLIAIQNTLNYE